MISKRLKNFMRIQVQLNVCAPLKIRKKIALAQSKAVYARFQNERLTLLCFHCRQLGHGKNYCPVQIIHQKELEMGWDLSLKPKLQQVPTIMSCWLWDDVVWIQPDLGDFKKGKVN